MPTCQVLWACMKASGSPPSVILVEHVGDEAGGREEGKQDGEGKAFDGTATGKVVPRDPWAAEEVGEGEQGAKEDAPWERLAEAMAAMRAARSQLRLCRQ